MCQVGYLLESYAFKVILDSVFPFKFFAKKNELISFATGVCGAWGVGAES
jgi:hypothetical protein